MKNNSNRLSFKFNSSKNTQRSFAMDDDEFIQEPMFIEDFLQGMRKVWPIHNPENSNSMFLFMKVDSAMVRININDIQHIEAMCDYVKIHTKERRYTGYSTLKGIEKSLPLNDFMRVHRSHIVRLDQISEIEKGTLTIGKNVIPVSSPFRQTLKKRLNIL